MPKVLLTSQLFPFFLNPLSLNVSLYRSPLGVIPILSLDFGSRCGML